ncbi:DUF3106 domain-containing protein [Variovorax sp. LG9.2]|uniref:DUF3106 domain-containing protein n=1 Tax=Variovorax sp. LG9.2 TaxID=3048626 RepID=UPI002B224E26|nr:DUF3106 domain-containing protein [Variovorax sp. LG9.2]MEB0058496.1 DUF3106 domain-containing protein [Variovorax sp. LG9.2]
MPLRSAFSFDFCALAPATRPSRRMVVAWAGTLLRMATAAIAICAVSSANAQLPLDAKGAEAGAPASAAAIAPKTAVVTKPLWSELNLSQQLALQPLAEHWDRLSLGHKRKWLAITRNYPKMTPEEQTVMHSRMSGWATLSQQQRVQARMNFAEVKQIPADERKAKWEAYQALSDEQKRELAEKAAVKPTRGAAIPAKPVSAQKFAPVPVPVGDRLPRIQLAPPSEPTAMSVRASRSLPATPFLAAPVSGAPIPAEAQVLVPAAPIERASAQPSTTP